MTTTIAIESISPVAAIPPVTAVSAVPPVAPRCVAASPTPLALAHHSGSTRVAAISTISTVSTISGAVIADIVACAAAGIVADGWSAGV
jgi:hypothetical protein